MFARELSRQLGDHGRGSILCFPQAPSEESERFLALPNVAVVVAPEPGERSPADVPVLEIELSRGIRVRIPATAPKELASAILKALVAR